MAMEPNKIFIIDGGALTNMYEGKESGDKMAATIQEARREGLKFTFITTTAAFQQSLWKADPNTPLSKIQDVLDHLQLVPSQPHVDFKNDELVRNDIVRLVNTINAHADHAPFLKKKKQ